MSSRCCFVLAVTLAALPALVLPAAAAAGTASTETVIDPLSDERGEEGATQVSLGYKAGRQERNRLHIEVDAKGATLTDPARIRTGRGCSRVPGSGRREVRCNFRNRLGRLTDPDDGVALDVYARLGARRDVAVVSGDFPEEAISSATLDGGPGPDRLRLNAAFRGLFIGGSGNDSMTGGADSDTFSEGRRRSGADTIRGGSNPLLPFDPGDEVDYGKRGRGVVADLAGDRDDGARGERDRIGADVESLIGGRGSDRLTGNAAANDLDGGGGRRDVIDGRAGPDSISHGGARGGVVRSRDGENDSIVSCTRRTRVLADGYDEVTRDDVTRCVPKRSEPVGLLVNVATTKGVEFVVRPFGATSGPYGVSFFVTCPADARPTSCGGQARLLASDGRTLGETAFDLRTRDGLRFLELPVSEHDTQRIRAAGSETATLLLDMPEVGQRRYALTLTAPVPLT